MREIFDLIRVFFFVMFVRYGFIIALIAFTIIAASGYIHLEIKN